MTDRRADPESMAALMREITVALTRVRIQNGENFEYVVVAVRPRTSDPEGPHAVTLGASVREEHRVVTLLEHALADMREGLKR